jgi:type I restriction enzyme S subunit
MGSLGTTYGGLVGKTREDFGVGQAQYIPFMAIMGGVRVTRQSLLKVRVANGERQNAVKTGDLLFNTSSETPDELAMCAVAKGLPVDTYVNSFCFGFRLCDDDTADSLFLAYLFTSGVGRRLMKALAQGAIRYNLSRSQFRKVVVTLPPLDEQRAMAAALSDADELIEGLQRLVAKKEAIKQGMMQQLLTGEARLPGFTGKWSEVRLGDIASVKTGSRNNQDKQIAGRYPFYVRSATVEQINTYSYDCEAVLVPGEGGIGSIFHYVDGKFEVHQRVYTISQFDVDTAGKFVYYYMKQFFGRHAMENSVKATVDSLRLPTFVGFAMRTPDDVDEQRAIVAVLDDGEAEIGRLRTRLTKIKAIKQGMMQELLTGRTRLPVMEAAAA